jgi:oxygen-independent coproporphyrinogen-3 oxidase
LVGALLKEIDLTLPTSLSGGEGGVDSESIETVYFGGGTPSLLTNDEILLILNKIRNKFKVVDDAEITFEVNPDDITEEKLLQWKNEGINRLSIGIQSFFDEDLKWMNRAHSAKQALDNLQLAKTHFENISIDLIYGTPALTNEKWKQNVDRALALNIPHLSCYALTVEANTPLYKMISQKQSPAIDADKQSEQFMLLMQWLSDAGFEHYEISNFAKPGWRSKQFILLARKKLYWAGTIGTFF